MKQVFNSMFGDSGPVVQCTLNISNDTLLFYCVYLRTVQRRIHLGKWF